MANETIQNANMNAKKKSKEWPENECPKWRWIAAVVVGFILGSIAGIIIMSIVRVIVAIAGLNVSEDMLQFLELMITFATDFWMLIIFIGIFCKTRIMSFIRGREGHTDKKKVATVAIIFFISSLFASFPTWKNTVLNEKASFATVGLSVLLSVIFLWMQCGLEELWFRGVIGRMFFGDNLKQKFSFKVFWYIVISSVLFAIMHGANPEVLNTAGIDTLFSMLSYLIPGVMFAVVTLHFGSLIPSMILHTINNFMCAIYISSDVSALTTTSIFVDKTTENTGFYAFLSTALIFLPTAVYLIIAKNKEKKNSEA